jgi:release factor glutamine methyltransferase
VLRRVAGQAGAWLAPGGVLLTETGEEQAAAAVEVLTAAGLAAQVVTDEDDGTAVVATSRPGSAPRRGPAGGPR